MTTEEHDFLKKFRVSSEHPSVTERYFKPQICAENAQCILTHSNRLYVITISPLHPIITEKKTVSLVNFDNTGATNRLKNKVSGKFKRGGQKLKPSSPLCSVQCTDESKYDFFSCATGTLIEVNERLIQEPNLLTEKPWSDGYIAIILPPFESTRKSNDLTSKNPNSRNHEKQKVKPKATEEQNLEVKATEQKMDSKVLEEQTMDSKVVEEQKMELTAAKEQKMEQKAMEDPKIELTVVKVQKVEPKVVEEQKMELTAVKEQKMKKIAMENPKIELTLVEVQKVEPKVVEEQKMELTEREEQKIQPTAVEEAKTCEEQITEHNAEERCKSVKEDQKMEIDDTST